jgi:AcrR family transcriptional regulator
VDNRVHSERTQRKEKMAVARTPRTSWVEEGFRALAVGGPDAVKIEALAEALGVTKGGFYGYFTGRQALLEEILDTWEQLVVDEVIGRVEGAGGDARAKVKRLFGVASFGGSETLEIELAIRDWARRDTGVARRLKRVDNRRMEYMRLLFGQFCLDDDEVEVRCLLTFALFIGSHFVAADHGTRSRGEVLALALRRLEE